MKYWICAQLEGQEETQCCKCKVWTKAPMITFQEQTIVQGGMPHPDEGHPNPTGRYMCLACAQMVLR